MHGFRMQGKNNTGINKNKKKKKTLPCASQVF